MKLRIRNREPRLYAGPDRRTRLMFKRHGKALAKALARRAERKALASGLPWRYKWNHDFHTGLKRFLLRCIATIRLIAT